MNIDSKFFSIVGKEHAKPFDWQTNNCGLFVGNIYEQVLEKDFLSELYGDYTDKETAFDFIKSKGGWNKILTGLGFVRRVDDTMFRGDIVICEHALGIWMGNVAFFAGGAVRERNQIESVYFYKESN